MNIFKPRTKDRICFVHVPKCGGQSIKSGIQSVFNSPLESVRIKAAPSLRGALVPDQNSKNNLHAYRENVLRYFLSDAQVGLVMGHYPCRKSTLDFFGEEWKFVTILRNPIDRFISHFLYNTHKDSEHFKQDQALDDFLKTSRAAASGEMYVRYFSEFPDIPLEQGIRDASANLDRFALVGVLDKLEEWERDYQAIFGGRLRIGRVNSSPAGAKLAKKEITEEQLAKIAALCEPSMHVYKHILNSRQS